MTKTSKLIIGATMTLALGFGFLHPIFPDAEISLKRLHIFLFNLLCGGSLILYYTEGAQRIGRRVWVFFGLALLYALSAALRFYEATLALSAPMLLVLELVRQQRFSFFPWNFFRRDATVSERFNHAALLCLSIGVVIADFVILNNEFYHWVRYEKLDLDVFFLGYSFPISLVTMSVMFDVMREFRTTADRVLSELSFWSVNLGVITFFVFIIFEMFTPEISAAITLFVTVCVILVLFWRHAPRVQQRAFLVSGMLFLVLTGVTGIVYIMRYFFPALDATKDHFLLLHAMVSIYGWNLSGLFIIVRREDFPIRLHSFQPVALHWAVVLVLAPIGMRYPLVALAAWPAFALLVGLVFFIRKGDPPREVTSS